jgi:SnoaL-like domain
MVGEHLHNPARVPRWLAPVATTLGAWLVAFLVVTALLTLFGDELGALPLGLRALVISGVLVALMVNLVMPVLTVGVARWLADPTAATGPADQMRASAERAVQLFTDFWAKPSTMLIPELFTDETLGFWPGLKEPTRGPDAYRERIAMYLQLMPDFHGEVVEHAINDDLVFIRWLAKATGPRGPIEFNVLDRFRLDENGRLVENVISFDSGQLALELGAPDAANMHLDSRFSRLSPRLGAVQQSRSRRPK